MSERPGPGQVVEANVEQPHEGSIEVVVDVQVKAGTPAVLTVIKQKLQVQGCELRSVGNPRKEEYPLT